ncbi:serine hydrolase domain-containing protein [Daejeonia sp. YH14]|uniref:serine hydrolase domain-containing protein n=1 Tax=Daejeonia sp. YH14 TaxID=3439042 RepID=UPI003F493F9A
MKKILQGMVMAIALLIAFSYILGYEYLFKGIAKTYLRGYSSADINDGKLFPSHLIAATHPSPWPRDPEYNKKPLPKSLVDNLEATKTASFLIIRDGKILHEEYWEGYSENTHTNSFSMAKTVTALLLGAAIDDGKIKDENELFSTIYPSYAQVPYGKKLTFRDLATMEAGLNWNENYKNPFSPNAKAYYGNSLAEAVLLRGFKELPGTRFEYQSGATQLLGFGIRKAVNIPLASYASQKLWGPLHMEQNATWSTDENGMEKTFCCIHSDSRDFAKLGLLMLNNGKSDTLQVISRNFIEKMRTPTRASNGAYGYSTWINNDATYKHYYFWGLLGQYIIMVPQKNLIIVRTGSYENQPKDQKGRPEQVSYLVNEVVEKVLH